MAFETATRRHVAAMAAQTKGTQNPLRWAVPKVGLAAGIYLSIRGSIAGTLSALNAAGKSSIVRAVRLVTNGSLDIWSISGPQYHWLLKDLLEDYRNPAGASDARAAVATGAFNLDMYLPLTLNSRETVGLFPLQNEQTDVQLEVEFETDSVVATGATVTATATPALVYLSVPRDPADLPPLNTVVQVFGDSRAVSAAGDVDYSLPRGASYVQVVHGLGFGVSGSDLWSRVQTLINQADVLHDFTPAILDIQTAALTGRTRIAGVLPIDYMGTAGLGNSGSSRDMLFSAMVTEFVDRITATGAGTLHTVRRQIVTLPAIR